jgi:hypothetical protein
MISVPFLLEKIITLIINLIRCMFVISIIISIQNLINNEKSMLITQIGSLCFTPEIEYRLPKCVFQISMKFYIHV